MPAQLIRKLEDHFTTMSDYAKLAAESVTSQKQPGWLVPKGLTGDPASASTAITEAFSRKELYDAWSTATQSSKPGTYADIIVITAQQDCLAVAERAFRNRHLSRVRAYAHAAARLKSQSGDSGVFQGLQKSYLSSTIEAGT